MSSAGSSPQKPTGNRRRCFFRGTSIGALLVGASPTKEAVGASVAILGSGPRIEKKNIESGLGLESKTIRYLATDPGLIDTPAMPAPTGTVVRRRPTYFRDVTTHD